MTLDLNDIVKNLVVFMEAHQQKVDELSERYATEKARIQGSGRYSTEEIARQIAELDSKTRDAMDASREANEEKVLEYLEQMRRIVREWICQPADPSLISTLATLQSLEVELSHHEIQAFATMVKNNYFSMRVLENLDRLGIIEAPQAKEIFAQITSIENMAMRGLTGYCGNNWELLDLLPNRVWRNIDYGKETVLTTAGAPGASEKVLERGEELQRMASVTISLPTIEEDEQEEE